MFTAVTRSVIAILVITWIAACGPVAQPAPVVEVEPVPADSSVEATNTPQEEESEQPVAVAAVASLTPLPSPTDEPPTATRRPTNTPRPTRTPRPTETATAEPTPTPPPTNTPLPSPTGTNTPNAAGEIVHVVQPGEDIYKIAQRYRVLWSQLAAYNNITAGQVQPGMQIRIPVGMMSQTYTGGGAAAPTQVAGNSADRVVLGPVTFDWQKLNNCGPTTTSVMLSYYGIARGQLTIAGAVKPNPQDKNVSPPEVAAYVRGQGLGAFIGVNGSIGLLERLVAGGFPVMVEQWMSYDGGVGHYRAVRGFDRNQQLVLQEDTFLGPGIWRSYGEFNGDWAAFGNTYLVFYPPEREGEVSGIVGGDWNRAAMWQRAYDTFKGGGGAYSQYWAGEALHQLGNDAAALDYYQAAINSGLPARYFWYNFGYMEALNNLGRYQQLLDFTAPVLQAMQLSEDIRYQRAVAYRALGQTEEARRELNLALNDHPGFPPAQALLRQLPAPPPPPATWTPTVPAVPTADPNIPTPDPNVPTPDPNIPTPDPNAPTPVPPEPTPVPVEPTPLPPEPTPVPPEPTPDPNVPTPDPNVPTPDPNATPVP